MAQYDYADLVEKNGLAEAFIVTQPQHLQKEIDNPVDPRTRRKLQRRGGIHCGNHRARQMTRADTKVTSLVYRSQQPQPVHG